MHNIGTNIPLILSIFFLFSCSGEKNKVKMAAYGTKTKFEQGEDLLFPDFTMRFVRLSSIPGPNNAKFNIKTYHFEIETPEKTEQIKWSSGTGRIAPCIFSVADKRFSLELKYALSFAKRPNTTPTLEENELVLFEVATKP